MKFLSSIVAAYVAVVAAGEDNVQHYSALTDIVQPAAETLQSVALSELHSHLEVQSPMHQIAQQCSAMVTQIRNERKAAVSAHASYVSMCKKTLSEYESSSLSNNQHKSENEEKASLLFKQHSQNWHIPAQKNASRAARNATIATQEVLVARGQKNRDAAHAEFLKLQAAFEKALSEIAVIGRVLNGEGSLGDRHGAQGFLEEKSCSTRFLELKEATAHVPQVSSLLEAFSKAFATVEAPTPAVAKTATGHVGGKVASHQSKTQSSTKDMDAINTILTKVRENLVKAMTLSYKQETKLINLWQDDKKERRKKINDDWISNWENLEQQGSIEEKIGDEWAREGQHRVTAAKHRKKRDEVDIMRDFLKTACEKEARDYPVAMSGFANELNALARVLTYLNEKVFPKDSVWSQGLNTVVSMPYKWKEESPQYLTVKNTYSTTNFDSDSVSCRTPMATVFSKVRTLTEKGTGFIYLDPNDLTHSQNMDPKRNSVLKGVDCQQFPTGVPVGYAHSCSEENYVESSIDLSGTPYHFGKAAKSMFKVLGRKTDGSSVKFSNSDKTVTIKVKGRCGDAYADDAPSHNADFRSDPIPLEKGEGSKK
jgi:hypothetical protein